MAGKRRAGRDNRRSRPAAPIVSQPVPVAKPMSRRELRAERKRQQRKRIGAAGIAGLVVAGLVAAAAVGFGVKKATEGGGAPKAGPTTLLLSVTDDSGNAVESVLLSHDSRTHRGVELLLPARVLSEVCGFGNQQLGEILALPDGQRLSRSAVTGMLGGVSVNGSWVLTTSQLSRLVDEVGGITADVDANVVQTKPGGQRLLIVSRGPGQHLSGSKAVAYATYTEGTADASANLVRLQAVIDGLLAALPADKSSVARQVRSLGAGAGSSLGVDKLAEVLAGLVNDARHSQLLPFDLPVQKIDAGGQPVYRVDVDATAEFVDANLAASLPKSARGAHTRVFVQNGVGTPGLVGTACSRLVDAGYSFAGSGNASHFGFRTSKVLVFNHSVATARIGNDVARALHLPVGDVAVSDEGQNVADVLVILGKDYKP